MKTVLKIAGGMALAAFGIVLWPLYFVIKYQESSDDHLLEFLGACFLSVVWPFFLIFLMIRFTA